MKKFITVVFVAMLTVVAFSQQRYTYSTKTLELQGAAPRLYLNGTGASINFYNGDVTLTQSTNLLTLAGGNLSLGTNSLLMTGSLGSSGSPLTKGWMTEVQVTTAIVNTTINPDANDGATLGQSGTAFSDMYLASGAVIDFDAGDFTIAHTNSQYVTVTGDLGIAGRLDLSNGGAIAVTGGTIDNTELYSLNGVTGSLAYSTENYGATGAGDIVLSIGATLTTVNITDVIKLTPTASPPASATEGMIYADTDHHLYYYNGTTWVQLDN